MQRTHSSKATFLLLAIALIATTFSSAQAQTNSQKPVQTPERVGVDAADALPLSLNEAIRFALENNNDIRTSRIDVEKAEHNLTARRGAYDPRLFSETYFERSSTPVASFLGGNNSGSLEQKDFTGRVGLT
jgi:outer membrane protein TolC